MMKQSMTRSVGDVSAANSIVTKPLAVSGSVVPHEAELRHSLKNFSLQRKQTKKINVCGSGPTTGREKCIIQRVKSKGNEEEQESNLDKVMSYLSASDLANLSQVNKATYNVVAPVIPHVLAQEMFQPVSDEAQEGGLISSANVEHIHKEDKKRVATRKKINFLAAKKQIATRALNQSDHDAIIKGEPMKGTGSGSNIADQVANGNTELLSASKQPMSKFCGGAAGHVAIKRPEYYSERAAMHQLYPETVKAPTISAEEISAHRNRFVSHENVMAAVEDSPESDQNNAREAHEVMFRGPLPLDHVVNLDGGLPQGEKVLSRTALARKKAREDAKLAGPSDNIRAYKTHAAAKSKLAKNQTLGKQYKIKNGGDQIYHVDDNVQDEKRKGKGRRK